MPIAQPSISKRGPDRDDGQTSARDGQGGLDEANESMDPWIQKR
jgi:hypothetical protein